MSAVPDNEAALVNKVMDYFYHPYEFVLFCYPWGKPGPLQDHDGPDKWQTKVLRRIGAELRAGRKVRIAVASGHGIGKTTLTAWIIHWFLSTRPNPQCVVTANTKQQLSDKTWRELKKWQNYAINGHWFEWTDTKYKMKSDPGTWFASAVPWTKERSEAFAGTHEKYVLILFDEASAIEDIIWETAEGAMTTKGAMWLAFGNPTRNTGRFRECWRKFRRRWITYNVDSRDAKMSDKDEIEAWKEDYGEDSDFFRARVKGTFPRSASMQFIPGDLVEAAQARELDWRSIPPSVPKLMGVDVARYGDDDSVVTIRQGRKLHEKIRRYHGLNTMDLAGVVAELINQERPDTVFVDGTGLGAGVVDRLIQLGYDNVVEVLAGSDASEKDKYYNARTEMWARMRKWLRGADIPEDMNLYEDFIGPEYHFMNRRQLMQLEPKELMKKRGLPSPDTADSVAMTFYQAVPVKREFENAEAEPEVV